LISSEAGNGIGGKGVAYGAKLIGHNFLGGVNGQYQSSANMASAFGGTAGSGAAKAHIFNASFGMPECYFSSSTSEKAAYENVKKLRGGKGGLIVKSAGNGFEDPNDPNNINSPSNTGCGFSLVPSISNGNAVFDQGNTVDNVIVVAAVNANGGKSSYSTTGANIWVSGFGGETGANATTLARYKVTSKNLEPAMISTDQSGCERGYEKIQVKGINFTFSLNDFQELGTATQTKLNPDCNYTSTFNGTSSAAPTVSGVIALMLEANPNLTWRDVKHILAMTANKVDLGFINPIVISESVNTFLRTGEIVEQGWITNFAGNKFHNWYGFGLADASTAVAMAKGFTSLPVQTSQTILPKTQLLSTEQNVNSQSANLTTVETVELSLNLAGNFYYTNNPLPTFRCLQFELTSPQGTKSILLNGGSGFRGWVQPEIKFLSNAFYGENGQGVWNIALKNICTSGNVYLPNANPTLTIRGR
jgi:subtilisin family serine protease